MDLYFLLFLLIVFILPSLFFLVQRRNEEGTRQLPPGPFKLPIIGNLHQMIGYSPYRSLKRLSEIYGPIMLLQLGSIPTLVISSADMAKQIFNTHDAIFSSRPPMYVAERLSYNYCDIGFAPYGDHGREARKLTVLELLSATKVQSFRAVRREEVALMISSIGSSGGLVDLSETFLCLSTDVLCRAAFGRKLGRTNGFHALLLETEELLTRKTAADFFPWMRWIHKIDGLDTMLEKNYRKLDEFYNKLIEEHLNTKRIEAAEEDFIDVMLRVQKEHILKINLTNNHIKGLLMDMFIAGTTTTAATLEWTMTNLINNPSVMRKAQEELRAVVGEKLMVEESDLPRLNYLKLTLKEAMRLQPAPSLISRLTTETCVIQGYHIPANTTVFINVKSIMRDARRWEKPEEYWPERFQDNPVDFKRKEYDYMPFGIGRRICPGIDFAVSITELVLANLLHCFNWELPQGTERMSVDMKVTMHKKIPFCLVAKSSNLCT